MGRNLNKLAITFSSVNLCVPLRRVTTPGGKTKSRDTRGEKKSVKRMVNVRREEEEEGKLQKPQEEETSGTSCTLAHNQGKYCKEATTETQAGCTGNKL